MEKIKQIFEKNKKIVWVVIAILLTIGINMSIDYDTDKLTFNGNQIVWLLVCVFIYFILKKSDEYHEKKLLIYSSVIGVICAICQPITKLTFDIWSTNEVVFTSGITAYFIFKIITYTIIFVSLFKIIFKEIEKIETKTTDTNKAKDRLKPTFKVFLVVAGILLIAWLPYFLNYYPGITSYDTNYQLMQGYGLYAPTNHHPIIHTLIITIIVKIGYALTSQYNFGIAIYVVLQMIVCACTFSFVIFYMAKKNIPYGIKLLTLLFFAFHPIVPQFSIAVWKDVPFSLGILLFIISIIEIITNSEKFLKSYKWNFLFIICLLIIAFFRNNGIYIILLTFPCILIAKRAYWKRIVTVFIIPIMLYALVTGPVFNIFHIGRSSAKEMLSIPMQQMAKIASCKADKLTEEEKEEINEYIPFDRAKELYRPNISDNIKNEFNEGNYVENKVKFFKLYFKLAFRFPLETIESFIANTYGYYCTDTITFPVTAGTYTKVVEREKFMTIETKPIVKIPIIEKMLESIYRKEMPIVSLLANIGFVFWIVITLLAYCVYKKKYQWILMYIPIAILYLTCLASPVSGELRYIYSMFICLPLFTAFTLKSIDKQ